MMAGQAEEEKGREYQREGGKKERRGTRQELHRLSFSLIGRNLEQDKAHIWGTRRGKGGGVGGGDWAEGGAEQKVLFFPDGPGMNVLGVKGSTFFYVNN